MVVTFIRSTRILTVACVAVAVLSSISYICAPFAKAATMEELQTQIAALMAQIAQMQQGLHTESGQASTTPKANRFIIGESVKVATAVRVRSTASLTGAPAGTQAVGQVGTIVDGPVRADGHIWWKIDYDSGVDGWTAEFWLVSNTSDGISSMQKGFEKITRGKQPAVVPGATDARIATVEVPAASIDRYLNSVSLSVTAANSNPAVMPWAEFKNISLFVNGMRVGMANLGVESAWQAVSGDILTHTVKLFDGNVKIAAGKTYSADLVVSVSDTAKVGDTWSFKVPEKGIVVWSSLTGIRKYGHNGDKVEVTIKGAKTNASSTPYSIDDVQSVTVRAVDPIPGAIDDEYALYRITLKSGKVYTVKSNAFTPTSYREEQFRKTGYTGDIASLTAMATVITTPATKSATSTKAMRGKLVPPTGNTTASGVVLGASTDVFSEISVTLDTISALLSAGVSN